MPSKSLRQKRLFAWAYACKNKKTKKCPPQILDIANSMSNQQLKDFFENQIITKFEKFKNNKINMKTFIEFKDNKAVNEAAYSMQKPNLDWGDDYITIGDNKFAINFDKDYIEIEQQGKVIARINLDDKTKTKMEEIIHDLWK